MGRIQDTGYKIQDKNILHHAPCIMHLDKKGFTLIEIIMIIVVVSIAIPTLLIMVGQEAKFGVDAELRVTATNVAQQLLEEIKTECFDELSVDATVTGRCKQIAAPSTSLGPEAGEVTLSLYDDADDFNDLAPASLGTTPCTDTVTVNGIVFTRQAVICYVNPGDLNTCVDTAPVAGSCNRTITAGSQTDYKKITVTVSNATLGSVALVTVVTNY
ncbi:MAG: hypothetical protein NTW44_05840 [Nitrospirae bacterium]|nr:hypothetical protein [Nitrospirota bacterium]